ncbi:SDR family NAD(P)-dependent oxidoreductase [Notoacmeibacter ruber]|uniref:SDR family oxidoreductase n=1 Tax=Notoacmeibacter ruber TaxID=2670375 RepID=A0A3L7J8H0_9HYPH|nr:SDR family oxidoreductase [Notoacmeibacter ruber]RLQ86830.1 SDR family oxidoreductase [Notoacmeibacter ruber]
MSNIFRDRVAVVTGAGSGIGRALSLGLAQRGAKLAISDIEEGPVEATANMARDNGADVIADRLDVTDRAAFSAYSERVVAAFGRVNQLFNNAGIASRNDPFVEMPAEQFDRVISVNLDGVVNGTRVFLPHLIASGEGHLVTISSLNGFMAQPHMSPYVTSKFAVRGLTEAIRQEMLYDGHPVEVTVVHPGGVATNIASRKASEIDQLPADKQAAARRRLKVYQEKLLTMPPEKAAAEILDGMERGRRRIILTSKAKRLDYLVRLMPSGYIPIVTKKLREVFG